VSKVTQLDDLDGEVGKDVEHVRPVAADSSAAVIVAFHRHAARHEFHVSVHQFQVGIEVASVEGRPRLGA
jgi:hypothetical protein